MYYKKETDFFQPGTAPSQKLNSYLSCKRFTRHIKVVLNGI